MIFAHSPDFIRGYSCSTPIGVERKGLIYSRGCWLGQSLFSPTTKRASINVGDNTNNENGLNQCWWKQSSRQGHFSPSPSQNRAWDSHLTRLFSFSIRGILYMIGLNLIIRWLLNVVFLSTIEQAEPFAPPPLQKLLHYYDPVRHSATHRLPVGYLELQVNVRHVSTS